MDNVPCLFTKTSHVFLLGDAATSRQRAKDKGHYSMAQTSEEDDKEGDEILVISAVCIQSSVGVVVGELEEGPRVDSRFGDQQVAKEEEGQEINCNGWLSSTSVFPSQFSGRRLMMAAYGFGYRPASA